MLEAGVTPCSRSDRRCSRHCHSQFCQAKAWQIATHQRKRVAASRLCTSPPTRWRELGQLGCDVPFMKTSCSVSFPPLARDSHTMPRERGMPGMYANAVPLGTYGSPYARPLLGGQQQIPKLLSSKWVLLPTCPSLNSATVPFWFAVLRKRRIQAPVFISLVLLLSPAPPLRNGSGEVS